MQNYEVSVLMLGTTAPFTGHRRDFLNGWAYDICGKHRGNHCTTFSAIGKIASAHIAYTFGLFRENDEGLVTFAIHGEVTFDFTGNVINYSSKHHGNGSQITPEEILALVQPSS